MLELIDELGLSDELIEGNPAAKRRYIQRNGQLHAVPMDPIAFLKTPLLSTRDKIRFVGGMVNGCVSKDQSVYDYASRRFGKTVAERVFDPFMTGIYAGDIKRLHMASAFPKMGNKGGKPRMRSLKKGMGQIITALAQRYQQHIRVDQNITTLKDIPADIVICTTPADVAARLFETIDPSLSQMLGQITYAPVAVVGMTFPREAFPHVPDGFGYLIPSLEKKDVLGVLIESNIFSERMPPGQVLVRVILGGAHHPDITRYSVTEIGRKALAEIQTTYGIKAFPLRTLAYMWPRAIPQYELNYPSLRAGIIQRLSSLPHILLAGNYWDGVSCNDCVASAKKMSVLPIFGKES
jgi:oxygen-dependent protoporphyrinogen oxidase